MRNFGGSQLTHDLQPSFSLDRGRSDEADDEASYTFIYITIRGLSIGGRHDMRDVRDVRGDIRINVDKNT